MFSGFSQDAIDFLSEIRLNNNQQFYEANRERYEVSVKTPLRALCDEMSAVIGMIDPKLDTRPGRTMSRIRRDTRFTRDKSPFRDHVWLGWRYPGESRSEGFGLYWGFGPDWMGWGCGCYAADKPLMDALRLHILQRPQEVRTALHQPGLDGRFELYGEEYRRISIPEDVPEDLKGLYVRKGFGLEHSGTQADWAALHTHEMADLLAADLLAMAPLQQLMRRMRAQAEQAQAVMARQIEEQRRAREKQKAPAARLTVRSAEEFDF